MYVLFLFVGQFGKIPDDKSTSAETPKHCTFAGSETVEFLHRYTLEFLDDFQKSIQEHHFCGTSDQNNSSETLIFELKGGDWAIFWIVEVDLTTVDSELVRVGGIIEFPQFYHFFFSNYDST